MEDYMSDAFLQQLEEQEAAVKRKRELQPSVRARKRRPKPVIITQRSAKDRLHEGLSEAISASNKVHT